MMTPGQVDLFSGERVLWEGAPARFPMFTRADALLVPFSLLWCGFAIFWTVSGVGMAGGLSPFALFGAIFVAIGLYFVFGRFIVRWLRLRTTTYMVTNRRVIVISAVFGRRRERSAYLDALPPPVMSSGTDVTGTITFGSSSMMDELRAAQGMFVLDGRGGGAFVPILVEVSHSRNVREIIAAAQARKQI